MRCGAVLEDNRSALAEWVPRPPAVAAARSLNASGFDARDAWDNCSVIGKVGSQAGCGDCWAWSATQAFESALCIAGRHADVELSKVDTAECCAGALCGYSKSCTAGTPSAALLWLIHTGVVTGGAYNSSQGCRPG